MSLTPPPPLWTDMDNWETPSLPLPVHVVYECRLDTHAHRSFCPRVSFSIRKWKFVLATLTTTTTATTVCTCTTSIAEWSSFQAYLVTTSQWRRPHVRMMTECCRWAGPCCCPIAGGPWLIFSWTLTSFCIANNNSSKSITILAHTKPLFLSISFSSFIHSSSPTELVMCSVQRNARPQKFRASAGG